jgi:hypothetical protein
MVYAWKSIGRRRTFKKDIRRTPFTSMHTGFESQLLLPKFLYFFGNFWKVQV